MLRHAFPSGSESPRVFFTVTVLLIGALCGGTRSAAQSAVGFIQSNVASPPSPQSTRSSVVVPFPAAQGQSHLNVVIVGWNDGVARIQSVSDTSGNSYALAVGPSVLPGIGTQAIYYASNIVSAAAGANSVTVTFMTPATAPVVHILEYSGVDAGPIDATSAAQGAGTLSTSGTVSTTGPNALLIAGVIARSAVAGPGAGFSTRAITALVQPPTPFVADSFTATNGTALASHAPNPVASWVSNQIGLVIQNGRIESPNFGDARAHNTMSPASADYEVQVDVVTNNPGSGNKAGVRGRDAGGLLGDGYEAYFSEGARTWYLDVWKGGNPAMLGSFNDAGFTSGTKRLTLRMAGSVITVLVDGTPRIVRNDSTVTAVGHPGLRNTGGIHDGVLLDNFVAAGLTAAALGGTIVEDGLAPSPGVYGSTATLASSASWIMQLVAFRTLVGSGVTAPTGLTGTAVSSLEVDLSWAASAGAIGYNVWRNGIQVGTTSGLSYRDTGVGPSTPYTYAVSAFDALGTTSTTSTTIVVTTPAAPDTIPPVVALTSPGDNGTVFGLITVSASASDNVGLAGLQFRLDGANLSLEDTTSPYSITWDTRNVSNGIHSLLVIARDVAGNTASSASISVNVNNTSASPAPVRYPANLTYSPIDTSIVQRWQTIAGAGSGLRPQVFMKVGDSNSLDVMRCFDGDENGVGPVTFEKPWLIYLDGRDYLKSTIQYFRSVHINDAANSSPNTRSSLATIVGSGSRSPLIGPNPTLIQEFDATLPQYAIIMFGSNDIQGTLPTNVISYETGLRGVVDALIARGVIPILTTMPERQDYAAFAQMVPAFNGVVRAIAQGRQIPLIDLNRELWPLPNHGMSSDNVHVSAMGSFENCQFRPAEGGLNFGMNMRNLITMETLDRIKKVMVDRQPAPDSNPARLEGAGSGSDPFIASALPFVDMRDTRNSSNSVLTNYSCSGSASAPGHEYLYRLDLAQPSAVRGLVLDAGANAVNINLLSAPSANSCLASGSRMIEATLNPGLYYIAVDSLSAGLGAEYTLSVTTCVVGDGACGSTDTVFPTVAVSSPANGTTVSGTVTVAADATDNVGVASVQFMLDGVTPLGAPDTLAPYAIAWDTSGAGVGPHVLTAVARDAAANVTTSASVTVTVTVASGGPATFVSDSFTGATGTLLAAHTPGTGGAWVDTQSALRILNNRIEGVNFGDARTHNAAPIGSANYEVSVDLTMNATGWGNKAGVRGRDAGNLSGNAYEAYYNEGSGSWRLDKWVGYSQINLGSFAQSFPIGTTRKLKLSMEGSNIKLSVDGVARIAVSDATISAAGFAGVFVSGGIHDGILLDNFSATGIGSTVQP